MTQEEWANLQVGDTFEDLYIKYKIHKATDCDLYISFKHHGREWVMNDRAYSRLTEHSWLTSMSLTSSTKSQTGSCCENPDIYENNPIGFFKIMVCRSCLKELQ